MKILLYPSAGNNDWKISFKQFKNKIDKFIFVDIIYTSISIENFKEYLSSIGEIENESIIGNFDNGIKSINKKFRELEPAYYTIELTINGNTKHIVFRKGFGQYALNELEDNSLDIFYHRGDSQGESGSNVFYFGNRKANHLPLAKLFDKLKSKLKTESLIVSDGSNTDSKQLNKLYEDIYNLKKEEVKKNVIDKTINIYGIDIVCMDVLDYRYNHTLVWKVSK